MLSFFKHSKFLNKSLIKPVIGSSYGSWRLGDGSNSFAHALRTQITILVNFSSVFIEAFSFGATAVGEFTRSITGCDVIVLHIALLGLFVTEIDCRTMLSSRGYLDERFLAGRCWYCLVQISFCRLLKRFALAVGAKITIRESLGNILIETFRWRSTTIRISAQAFTSCFIEVYSTMLWRFIAKLQFVTFFSCRVWKSEFYSCLRCFGCSWRFWHFSTNAVGTEITRFGRFDWIFIKAFRWWPAAVREFTQSTTLGHIVIYLTFLG